MQNDQKEHWKDLAKHGPLAAVIDPNDKKGCKNKYIVHVRNKAIREFIPQQSRFILDFGCGSGNISKELAADNHRIFGVDISFDLLRYAVQQNDQQSTCFTTYDGSTLPYKDNSMDFIVTYVVLTHILDDQHLERLLCELRRVLSKDGRAVFIEHTRVETQNYMDSYQRRRILDDYFKMFEKTGLKLEEHKFIRHSRFPLLYLVQLGLISEKYFDILASLDHKWATLFSKPRMSYIDTAFKLCKD